MKKELNIAAILMEKPNAKLWSPAIGECNFRSITMEGFIMVKANSVIDYWFSADGKLYNEGECLLFPSKQMRDWSKFAWKKGDVLVKDSTCVCVFKEWNNDKHTSIKCKYIKYMDAGSYAEDKVYITNDFRLASQEEKDAYISSIEEHYGGKLNLETLEIEQSKPEFNDGDIVYLNDGKYEFIFIFKYENVNLVYRYASFCLTINKLYIGVDGCLSQKVIKTIRQATASEKLQLFDALAKEGKRWNSDTKQIEDLPKKCEFKPFQKVMIRSYEENEWRADFFSYYDEKSNLFPYVCVGSIGSVCIPYNGQTKHLLGTTDEWKGGEG